MNEDRLQELATSLKEVFNAYDIDLEGFQLKLIVTKGYYDSVKDNFSTRNALDAIVGTQGEDWTINILYLPPMSIADQE